MSFNNLSWMKSRSTISVIVAAISLTSLCSTANAQDDKDRERLLRTSDGWQIPITYFESKKKKEASVVVLLHMKGGNRLVWQNGFAQKLNDLGYAVITVDLRQHGRSKSPEALLDENAGGAAKGKPAKGKDFLKPNDYANMVFQDMEAIKKFIYEEHQNGMLNMRKFAIVAAEMTGPIALNYTVIDWTKAPHPDGPNFATRTPRGQDVQALVLISPDANCPQVKTNKAVRDIKKLPISFFVCVGEKDSKDKRQARRLFDQMGGKVKNKKNTLGKFYQAYPVKLRGTDLLGRNLRTEAHIIGFLEKYLNKLEIDWRDRQSKLKKKAG